MKVLKIQCRNKSHASRPGLSKVNIVKLNSKLSSKSMYLLGSVKDSLRTKKSNGI